MKKVITEASTDGPARSPAWVSCVWVLCVAPCVTQCAGEMQEEKEEGDMKLNCIFACSD